LGEASAKAQVQEALQLSPKAKKTDTAPISTHRYSFAGHALNSDSFSARENKKILAEEWMAKECGKDVLKSDLRCAMSLELRHSWHGFKDCLPRRDLKQRVAAIK